MGRAAKKHLLYLNCMHISVRVLIAKPNHEGVFNVNIGEVCVYETCKILAPYSTSSDNSHGKFVFYAEHMCSKQWRLLLKRKPSTGVVRELVAGTVVLKLSRAIIQLITCP